MRYAKTGAKRIVDARDLQTSEQRCDWIYLYPECEQHVTFVFSQGKTHHFRHPQGHKVCVLSSVVKQGRMREVHWQRFLRIQNQLGQTLQAYPEMIQKNPVQWELPTTSIYLLPYYYPEQRCRNISQNATDCGRHLLFLITQHLTPDEFSNINRYGCYRTKPRAIHTYAQTYSIPPRLVLTDGTVFYELSNRMQVYSPRFNRYCTTIFDYELEERSLDQLIN